METEPEPRGVDVSTSTTSTGTTKRSETLYFAFGSNLSSTQMQARCPSSTAVGLGFLTGWEWIINERGYANIVRAQHHFEVKTEQFSKQPASSGVYGVLYRLPPADEQQLDMHEGVPWAYEKVLLGMKLLGGGETKASPQNPGEDVEALVYVDKQRTSPSTPKVEYIDRMNRGIQEAVEQWQMPLQYVDEVMRPFIPVEKAA